MAGHPGIAKTLELTTRTFWWPNMKKDIEKYIKACHECQISKPDQQPWAAPLQPNEIPSEPWAVISIDLIGPLVPSKGKDMILVIVDRFSKKAYFLPCNTNEEYLYKLEKAWQRWKSAREEAYSKKDCRRTVPAHTPIESRVTRVR
jgi:hypothetical protein